MLQSLMGNWFYSGKTYSVITLNYSGILQSPFEFYSNELQKEENQLSAIFLKIMNATEKGFDPKKFKWNLGKIDQKLQKDRYSPVYNKSVGIIGNRLIGQKQFADEWQKTFKLNIGKYQGKFTYTQEQKQNALNFDLACYKTIVFFSQNLSKIQPSRILDKPQILSVQKYHNVMLNFFDKSYLDEDKKIKKTLAALHHEKVDIGFIQQSSQKFMTGLIAQDEYHIIHEQNKESMIILKKKTFPNKCFDSNEILSAIDPKFIDELNWNNDTVICFNSNLILISGHLSSKKQKNSDQVAQMWKSLDRLRKIYPQRQIIVGADCNSFVKLQCEKYTIYPSDEKTYTTLKKRTYLQPQVNKAQEIACVCRDHLISTLIMQDHKVTTIQGNKSDILIPAEQHPYDHFVVAAKIQIK